MISTLVPPVIDALVALSRATLGLEWRVFDGIGTGEDAAQFVVIGIPDPTTSSMATAASMSQSWATLGNRSRDEEGTIDCVAYAVDGDNNQKVSRDAVASAVEAIVTALHTDLTLGGIPGLLWSDIRATNYDQGVSEFGAEAQLSFQLAFRARI